jgi:hypothetical protein
LVQKTLPEKMTVSKQVLRFYWKYLDDFNIPVNKELRPKISLLKGNVNIY